MKAVAKGDNKVAILTDKGRKVATLSGEEAIKFAHELMDVAEKALKKSGCFKPA